MRFFHTLSIIYLLSLSQISAASDQQQKEGLHVVVSIKPVHSIVMALMEGVETPRLLIDQGQTPYDFQLDNSQTAILQQADLLIWVGAELEESLAQPIATLDSSVQVIELLSSTSMKILLSRSDNSRRDPFFWLDNRNMLILLDDLTRMFQQLDPIRAHVYARNRRAILAKLSRIDREYEYGYRGLKAGLAVQYYDTMQYFEQAYAFKSLGQVVQSPRNPAQALPLLNVQQRINSGEAICLLTEHSLPNPHFDLLTENKQINTAQLDSLGSGLPAGPDLYFQLMDQNRDAIKRCINADMQEADHARKAAQEDISQTNESLDGSRFMLTDHLGALVNAETMQGKYQILYFGYTSCPDVCPTSLQMLLMALRELGDKAELIQPYFITIDPQRDTVKIMRDYVEYFDKRLIGVTGSSEMIRRMADLHKVKYEKVITDPANPDYYVMDHSASLILLDPNGRYITRFLHGMNAEQLVEQLLQILP